MILAFDTSTAAGSVALQRADGRVRIERLDTLHRHSAALVPVIDKLLREFGPPGATIESVVVGLGPGSFTGTRIGVAAALGIRAALGCDLYGIPSFDAVALETARRGAAEGALGPDDRIAVAGPARHATMYLRLYRVAPGGAIRPEEPCRIVDAAELAAADPACIVSPDPARLFARLGPGGIPLEPRWLREPVLPRADCLIDLVRGPARIETAPCPPGVAPEPVYLHPPAEPPPPPALR